MKSESSVRSASRDELINNYLPLARRLAARYRNTSVPLDDLVQVASLALVLAADRFDPERGAGFASFAVPTIMGELRRHIRDHTWATRVPRTLQENVLRVSAAESELSASIGRSPTPAELAEASGLELDDVVEAMEASSAYRADSLDRRLDGDDAERDPLLATLGRDEPGYDLVEFGVSVRPVMAAMSHQEQRVVAMRFVEDLTQSEIARRIGVSQMQVSRLLRRALDRMHAATELAV